MSLQAIFKMLVFVSSFLLTFTLQLSHASHGDDFEIQEVYGTSDSEHASRDSEYDADEDDGAIKLSRPEDAAERVAYDGGFDLVPGAEKLKNNKGRSLASVDKDESAIEVPKKLGVQKLNAEDQESQDYGRGIASDEALSPVADPLSNASYGRRKNTVAKVETTEDDGAGFLPVIEERKIKLFGDDEEEFGGRGLSSTNLSNKSGVQEISLIVTEYGYFPKQIFVTQNTPVKIYLTTPSKSTLCFMQDQWSIKRGIHPGRVEEFTFVPHEAGSFRFYCPIQSLEGLITVREMPTFAPTVTTSKGRAVSNQKMVVRRTGAGIGNSPRNAEELRSQIED